MNTHKERNLLDKKWKKLKHHLSGFLLTEDQTELHRFRVQVKKIKSILLLLSINKKSGLKRAFKPVNKIFHKAGHIREACVHLQLADQFKIRDHNFYSAQTELMTKGISKFQRNSKKHFNIINATRKKLKSKLRKLKNKQISKFYESELNDIVLFLAKREFDESMHECRKKIKHVIYNHKVILKSSENIFQLNLPYLKKVEEKLGQWHDAVLARDLLELLLKDKENTSKLDVKISGLQRSISSISANFWQKATRINNRNSNHFSNSTTPITGK